ncbi:MAG: DUF1998 domain-containing protein [Blastocatellia bacterium]|nr:DUF1998 domain-containing protein [Blastocatellia bacterium]
MAQLVKDKWSTFEDTESSSELKVTIRTLRKTNLLGELENYKEEEIWQEIERQKQGQEEKTAPKSDIKKPEWELFTNKPRFKNDYLEFEIIEPPKDYQDYIEKIVLVEKLRVVRALIGFTRIEPPYDDLEEKERGEWSPISNKKPEWVPASDTKGEGIFIQFREDALKEWEDRILPSQYYEDIKLAHNQWRQERGLEVEIGFPGLRYMLLHSFSHALMRQFSIECGYSAASLAERIYSSSRDLKNYEGDCMGGVLIYTAAPDSEGTLGGLVSLGQGLTDQINKALEQMRLCSSDPLCSEHSPREGMVSLHVAACHACLFSPETSCEKGNRYLDRSLLMPNLKHLDLAFFGKN